MYLLSLTHSLFFWLWCILKLEEIVPSSFLISLVESTLNTATFFGSVKYKEELKSIARLLGINPGRVIMLQLAYEAFAACTSIVTMSDAGHPIHIRTMDWEMPQLQPLTIEVATVVMYCKCDVFVFLNV